MAPQLAKALAPIPPRESVYGVAPSCVANRAASLPGMVFLKTRDLFPDSPEVFWPPENPEAMRKATRDALASVNMDIIKPGDSVNLLGSHHGWTILGGRPYTEMIKTVKDVIQERTGCTDIRLRAGVGLRLRFRLRLLQPIWLCPRK